jgi:hypothetical protein
MVVVVVVERVKNELGNERLLEWKSDLSAKVQIVLTA